MTKRVFFIILSSQLVGSVFNPLEIDKGLDEKYQKLADNLTLWNGLNKLRRILPLGAPVAKVNITSKYGMRKDPFTGAPKKHKGVDFAGKIGTELMAVAQFSLHKTKTCLALLISLPDLTEAFSFPTMPLKT